MPGGGRGALEVDWLELCRRAARGVRQGLDGYPLTADRAVDTGPGMGGDTALVIDRVAEDAVFAELEGLGVDVTAVSEERGRVTIGEGGPVHVVIDPIDGSRNAKRRLPLYSLSIAVANGERMGDVEFAYVHDFGLGEEWWAWSGNGAYLDGDRLDPLPTGGDLEMVGLETIHPRLVAGAANALVGTEATRLRGIGSIALSLCSVAAARLDGMVTLAACRSVDIAAGQLIVTEAGGAVAFPEAGDDPMAASLNLDMRTRALAARSPELLARLLPVGQAVDDGGP